MLRHKMCHATIVLPVHNTCGLHKFFVCLQPRIVSRDASTIVYNTIVNRGKVGIPVRCLFTVLVRSTWFLKISSLPLQPQHHLQNGKKKQSGVSYASKREQQLLLELYEARRDILEDKRTEFTMRGKLKKAEAYESIAKEYLTCNLT